MGGKSEIAIYDYSDLKDTENSLQEKKGSKKSSIFYLYKAILLNKENNSGTLKVQSLVERTKSTTYFQAFILTLRKIEKLKNFNRNIREQAFGISGNSLMASE